MNKVSVAVLAGLIVLGAYPGLGLAQDSGAKTAKLNLGIKAGVAMAGCSGLERLYDPDDWGPFIIPDVEKGLRIGMATGIYACYKINNNFYIQPEVLYSQEGCKRTVNVEINQILGTAEAEWRVKMEATTKLDYVEIPVLLKASFKNDAVVSPYILAGPSVGIKMSAKMPYDVSYNYREFMRVGGQTLFSADTSWTRDYDIDDLVKSTKFSIILGAGCTIDAGPGVISCEFRYCQGLGDVLENTGRIEVAPAEFLEFDKLKGYTLRFSVGYSFPIWR